jgi:homoserine dehydrogenase
VGPAFVSAPFGVGLLGLGTVGAAVARAMADRDRAHRLEAMAGRPLRLIGAAVRDREKERDAGGVAVTSDPFAILDDPEVHVVVEVIGGTAPARDLHLAAFERGKHVVTANKELVAKSWNELHEAARLAKRELRFEASVAAAIPVVAATRQLGASRPRVLRGLLNGTTTYICSQLDAGRSFDDALTEATRLGYAEADPSADVDGFDPAYKIAILVSLLEGRHFHPDNVSRTSLRGVSPQDVAAAHSRGARIRYLATADFGEKATKARVAPEEVPLDSLEGAAAGPTNVVRIETDLAGTLVFTGPGAGGDATASAILGDVIAIARAAR